MQFPYFTGDILWGLADSDAGDAVVVHTSIQPLDDTHPLIVRAREQAERFDQFGGPPMEDQIRAGQMPLLLAPDPPRQDTGAHPGDIALWAYMYAGVERPGVRVREMIQGDDISGAYWRFGDAYHMQSGNGRAGDLPGDFKFLYAAGVIRDVVAGEGVYAIYGSGWVHARDDDPLGSRFMPPFQGAAGGPNGGPLFTVHGREVDLFFLPMGVRPGALLEVGDTFRMAGPIMPTLPSLVEYTVTAPDGTTRSLGGRANAVGYFYDPLDDFALDQPGLWTVEVRVTHDGMTSAGPVEPPYPTGGVLSPDGKSFTFVVTGPSTQNMAMTTSFADLTPPDWFNYVREGDFLAAPPNGWEGGTAKLIVTMPGTVLLDEEVSIQDGLVRWHLDAWALNALANNFDAEEGIADTVIVTLFAEGRIAGEPASAVGSIVVHGARVPATPDS